jgi:uracil-DNA glycosylase
MTDKQSSADLEAMLHRIRACRICRDEPLSARLPHEPRPVLRVTSTARLLIASQAPGVRVHASGLPFNDASGDRLRQWMNISRDVFYDESRIAIIPMGFCFPGHDDHKGDLPPRRECRSAWHDDLLRAAPHFECILAIGRFAQAYHFARLGRPLAKAAPLDQTVRRWREFLDGKPQIMALPHPSWRNSGWIKRNPWFETDVLPVLRLAVATAIR